MAHMLTCKCAPRACGVLAFELIVGHCPFEQESRSATYESIMYRWVVFNTCAIPNGIAHVFGVSLWQVSRSATCESIMYRLEHYASHDGVLAALKLLA